MSRVMHLVLMAAAVMGLLAIGALLDGPSDLEVEQAVQTDLDDAIAQARREALAVRTELARLEAERTEPAPAAELPRYAMLEQPQ